MMDYQRVTFYYYTGTGNSFRVVSWMADTARDVGTEAMVRPVGLACPAEEVGEGPAALLGLVMPTHGFTAPWAVISFALRLPRFNGTHAVVVATRAGSRIGRTFTPGFEGSGTLLIALILALKGYRIRGVTGIDMPTNWLVVHPGLRPDTVAGIVTRARRKSIDFMGAILSGGCRFDSWIVFLFGLLILPISLAYLLIGRFFLAKLFFASEQCTGCGLCAEHCPNGAIVMHGSDAHCRPYWTFHCESCMRCMAFCPTQAVEASHLLGVAAYLLAGLIPTATFLAWLAVRLPLLTFLTETPNWLLESINAIVAIGLAYPIFYFLLRIGWVKWFFTVTTLTHYYRRYHEPETALKDLR